MSITSNMSYSDIGNKNSDKLRVAVMKNSSPFASCQEKIVRIIKPNLKKEEKKTVIEGIAVKIWEVFAKKYNVNYEYICIDSTYNDAIKEIGEDKYDVILGDFTTLASRSNYALFTRPYYISEVRIYRKSTETFVKDLITNKFLISLFFLFFAIILIYSFIFKYIKDISIIESVIRIYKEFFTNEIFLLTPRKENTYIKLINFSWSLLRFIFFAIIITQLIDIIIQTSKRAITDEELANVKEIYVIDGTSYIDQVKALDKVPITKKTAEDIRDLLINSKGDVYWLMESQKATKLLGLSDYEKTPNHIAYDLVSIAINKNKPELLDILDSTIVSLQDSGDMLKICKGYLPDRFDACLL